MMRSEDKLIANNKKAKHEYFIEEVFEAGIALTGTEVKSIRLGKVSIKEAFCNIKKGEALIQGMHITPYEFGNRYNVDPIRDRKLLLNRHEINKILGKIKEKGYAFIPLSINLRHGLIKVDVALARGKKLYDKRQDSANKDASRKIEQALKRSL